MTEPDYAPAHAPILMVGLPLQLVIGAGHGKVNCGATLLGWKAGAWLICEWPTHLGHGHSRLKPAAADTLWGGLDTMAYWSAWG